MSSSPLSNSPLSGQNGSSFKPPDFGKLSEEEQDEIILDAEAIKEAHLCSNPEAARSKDLHLLTENQTIALVRAAKRIILERLAKQMEQGLINPHEGVDKLCERIEKEVLRVKTKKYMSHP